MRVSFALNNGVAIIDSSDRAELSKFAWRAKKHGETFHAVTIGHKPALRMHRVIMGAKTREVVKFRDGNGLHNWRENLVLCDRSGSVQDSRPHRDKSGRSKGVSYNKSRGTYRVQIMLRGNKINLGSFTNAKAAAHCYDFAAVRLFASLVRINFPARKSERGDFEPYRKQSHTGPLVRDLMMAQPLPVWGKGLTING